MKPQFDLLRSSANFRVHTTGAPQSPASVGRIGLVHVEYMPHFLNSGSKLAAWAPPIFLMRVVSVMKHI